MTEDKGQRRVPRQVHSGAGTGRGKGDDKNHQPETIILTVPSHPKYLYVIRSAVYPVLIDAGFSRKETRRIVLALDEACSNIIKYAYLGDPAQLINVRITVEQDRVQFQLTDTGRKPDVSTITPRRLDNVRPGGLGTHFIRSVFDSVVYDTGREQGTVLTLVKVKQQTAHGRSSR